MEIPDSSTRPHPKSAQLWKAGLAAAGLAAAFNAGFYGVGVIGGFLPGPAARTDPTMTVTLGAVLVASVIGPLAGTALFAVLRRVLGYPIMVLAGIGGAVLLISSIVPYALAPGGLAGITPANCGVVAVLELMHGFTAIITFGVLSTWNERHPYVGDMQKARTKAAKPSSF